MSGDRAAWKLGTLMALCHEMVATPFYLEVARDPDFRRGAEAYVAFLEVEDICRKVSKGERP